MQNHLVLSIHCEDKPGVIKSVAKVVAEHNGNWLESRFSQLAGLFAGIVRVSVDQDDISELTEALSDLQEVGLFVTTHTEPPQGQKAPEEPTKKAHFHALGPDKPGIVKEFTQAFIQAQLNICSINSKISSMPYSGDPLFEAEGVLDIPETLDVLELQDTLSETADAIGIDFTLREA